MQSISKDAASLERWPIGLRNGLDCSTTAAEHLSWSERREGDGSCYLARVCGGLEEDLQFDQHGVSWSNVAQLSSHQFFRTSMASPFRELPDRDQYPDYYRVISDPETLDHVAVSSQLGGQAGEQVDDAD